MTEKTRVPGSGGLRSFARLVPVLTIAAITAFILWESAPTILERLYRLLGGGEIDPRIRSNFLLLASRLPFSLLGGIAGAFLGHHLLRSFERLIERWDRMDIGDKVTLFIGILTGIVAAMPFLVLFQNLRVDALYAFPGLIGLIIAFGAVSVYTLQSMAEILPWKRGSFPSRRSGIKILDTNVIIDGRIYDVARTGFLDGQFYVPGFVLEELQHIADSHDALRRQRGRRGLDVLRHMQADFGLDMRTHDRLAPDLGDDVDSRLVRLAKHLGADIVTNDFNLNRVAGLQDIHVLSLNDLALALRSNVMPQESLTLTVTREGNQSGQGVGYLEDGTMVVIENGKSHIGETLDVVVTQVIQTERGKMVFAEVNGHSRGDDDGGGMPVRRKPRGRA